MDSRIKTTCLVLITLAILVGVGFYAWSVWERQAYFEEQSQTPPIHLETPSEWRGIGSTIEKLLK